MCFPRRRVIYLVLRSERRTLRRWFTWLRSWNIGLSIKADYDEAQGTHTIFTANLISADINWRWRDHACALQGVDGYLQHLSLDLQTRSPYLQLRCQTVVLLAEGVFHAQKTGGAGDELDKPYHWGVSLSKTDLWYQNSNLSDVSWIRRSRWTYV